MTRQYSQDIAVPHTEKAYGFALLTVGDNSGDMNGNIHTMQFCVTLLCCTTRWRCTVAAQSKSSFMLVLCLRQIPAKANKLILSHLLSYLMDY